MDLRAELQSSLAGAYAIERELGRGGMATVYLARDNKHHRLVALKVLHPELAHALGAERFLREIELSAGLQHPHILTVLDSGDAGGQLWFTMPFVEGESLRDRLTRERQLPLEDSLRITREAADALDYAHRHGIVHRDIKPENILLAESHALVADFGIGKALGGGEHLTATGLVMGTAAYMSPEQATGEKEVGPRSDIYSLASVLYEMLAGETPFHGPTAQAMLARRLTESPRPLREVREAVPPGVSLAIDKALARVPADRFATAADFAHALQPTATTPVPFPAVAPPAKSRRRVPALFTMLLLGVAIGLGVLFAWKGKQGSGDAGLTRLAVLPFENLGDSADAYFADGMTDEVRGKLSSLGTLLVTSRQSSNQYRAGSKSEKQIGEELGVRYLLTATVRWEKNGGASRVRVTPELVDVSTSATRWQQPFDAAMTDVFKVQGDIATEVARALDVALADSLREQLEEKPTQNLAAWDAYLRGEEISGALERTDPPTLRRAVTYYEQATVLDPGFVRAWARLAVANGFLYANGVPNPEGAEAARRAAEQAMKLAPTSIEAHIALGQYLRMVVKDFRRAGVEFDSALSLAPRNPEALAGAAVIGRTRQDWGPVVDKLNRAIALDPRSVRLHIQLSGSLLWTRQYSEGQEVADRGAALSPTNLALFQRRAMLKLAQGDLSGAQGIIRSAPREIDPASMLAYVSNFWDLYWILDESQQQLLLRLNPAAFDGDRGAWGVVFAQVYWLRGDSIRARAYADTAQAAITEQLRQSPTDEQRIAIRGLALAFMGRKAEAIEEGKRAVAALPISRDADNGAYLQHLLVRIYIIAGEPEKALDLLEPLLKVPYYLSPGWLRVDPNFAPLRGNPRFERLARE